MGSFLSWTEWQSLRETNARQRSVKAALQGTGVKLPGSAAACPSTNPLAMNVAGEKGEVRKAPKSSWRRFKESQIARPDYSLDRWIASAKELGDDVNSLVHKAKDDEEEMDKDKDKKSKETPKPEDKPDPKTPKQDAEDDDQDKKPETPEQKKAWTQLRKIHKDRMPNFKKPEGKPEGKNSEKPSSNSSKRSPK